MGLPAPQAMGSIALAVALAACSNSPAPAPELAAPTRATVLETGISAETRWRHTATLLADGTVLVAGGIQSDGDPPTPSASAVLYVPGQPDFEPLPDLTTPRYDHTATRLLDGTVLVAGGFDERGQPLSAAELFLPDSRSFEPVAPMIAARGEHLATLLSDGRVLLVDREQAGVEVYDPAGRAFAPLGTRGSGKRQTAVTLSDGSVLLLGSDPGEQELFDPSTNRFTPLEPGMMLPPDLGGVTAAVRLDHDEVGIFGTQSFVRVSPQAPCVIGQSSCDGQCVVLSRDADNCGACGRACGESQYCSEGECWCNGGYYGPPPDQCLENELSCTPDGCASCLDVSPSSILCGDRCVDLQRDPLHCGACDNACERNETCSGGRCVCTKLMCGSACVDAYFDSDNCLGCGIVCSDGAACWNGVCRACPEGLVHCGTGCVDVSTDPKNCGACGTECAPGEPCIGGLCRGECPPGKTLCEDGCATLASDPLNCSFCGFRCGGTCWAGSCFGNDSEAPALVTTLVAGSVWVTTGYTAHSIPDDGFQWSDRRLSLFGPSSDNFGGPGHTATALPDGSVLIVGGSDTDAVTRLHAPWRDMNETPVTLLDPISLLLADGRVLVLASDAFAHDPVAHIEVKVVGMVPRVAALQSTGEVLVVGTEAGRGPTAKVVAPDLADVRTLDLPIAIAASGLAIPGGTMVMAGDGIEVVRPSGSDGDFEVERVSVPEALDCSRPALARLSNGHVLVVGSEVAYELDVRSLDLSPPVALKQPRCRGGIIVQPGGALIVGGARGSDGQGAPSITVEAYDISTRTTEVQNVIGGARLDVTTIPWFDRPLLFANGPGVGRLNRELGQVEDVALESSGGFPMAPRLLADGSLFGPNPPGQLMRISLGSRASRNSFSAGPSLRMNSDTDFADVFSGAEFPGNASEGSTGSTQSSPTNVPIPVWFPAEGGWPMVGTLEKVGSRTVYHVPRTPFPGLGLLFLSTNGTLNGYGPAVVEPSSDGTDCLDAGECASGFCVDGVCCNEACDGTCVACSAAEKGDGEDGVCEPVTAGTPEAECEGDDLIECDRDGTCDGRGECAMVPDGTECAPGFECSNSECKAKPAPPTGEAGAGNEGGAGSQGPHCDGDVQVELNGRRFECPPYRCALASGECLESCESNRDCVGGYACTAAGKCEKALNVTRLEGCGCRLQARASGGSSAWALALSALFWLGRRSKRRRALASRLG